MFIDILGRIKQWTGIVQNKLNICKNEIDTLRKELLARICEMDIKTREIEDLKAQITHYQNSSQLNVKSLTKKNNPSVKLVQNEKSNKKIYAEESSVEDGNEETSIKNPTQAVDQIKEEDEEPNLENVETTNYQENEEDDEKEINKTKKTGINNPGHNPGHHSDEEVKRVIDMNSTTMQGNTNSTLESEITLQQNEEKTERESELESEITLQKNEVKTKRESELESEITLQKNEVKTKRESELESEITQLRKEYERVIKERAEYENAIQRALLRGVSSLNVEALRVLRCPPIPCCTPCSPCPATAGIIPSEPVVLCPAKKTKRRSGQTTMTMCTAKVSHDRNSNQIDCTTKWPCATPCCRSNRNRKSSNGNMIFVLRQDKREDICEEDPIPVCGSAIVKKIELPSLRNFET
ncbi:neurofilament medium polypeptide-like [Cataglyphis hispanica]|uniref:neurofilament medium polypeptide-like n=1 Tax=Cataglyphis hispanica TaxID=1086592 RepID=UPI00217F4A29|nr:neurofilament medium polypeptide-like [Cataglyphis hispanica]